jgi:hypothetical protein
VQPRHALSSFADLTYWTHEQATCTVQGAKLILQMLFMLAGYVLDWHSQHAVWSINT